MKPRLADIAVPVSVTPAELAKFASHETEKWAKVIKSAV